MKQPKVVILGHVCIDHNVSEHAKYTSWGSGVLYMSKYFQEKLDLQPIIITQYGRDLQQYATDFMLNPVEPPYERTLIYENTTTSVGRTQRCLNIPESLPLPLSLDLEAHIRTADVIILAPLLPNYSIAFVEKFLSLAPKDALKMLCPQGYFRQTDDSGLVRPRSFVEARELLPLFDVTIFSDEDYPDALRVAETWKRVIDTDIVVTQGPRGASIAQAGGSKNIPTHPVPPEEIVDSVGCGDVFGAALAYELYKTHDLEAAIKAGHKIARDKLLSINTKS